MSDDPDRGGPVEDPWERTLEDLDGLAEELAGDGWTVFAAAAAEAGLDPGERALVVGVEGPDAEDLEAAFAACAFGQYDVFSREFGDELFAVVRLFDGGERVAVLLAGRFDLEAAAAMIEGAEGAVFTRVEGPDGDVLETFRHDTPGNFLPGE